MKLLDTTKDTKIAQVEKLLQEIKATPDTSAISNVNGEGLEALMGQVVTIFCAVYIYTGKLVGVNTTCIKLENPKIVYETGSFADKAWKDAQALPSKFHYVATGMIESFGVVK